MAGISKRHLQRLLNRGGVVPGAEKSPGGHWKILDSKELRAWAENFQKWQGVDRRPATASSDWKKLQKQIGVEARKIKPSTVASKKRYTDFSKMIAEMADPIAKEICKQHALAVESTKNAQSAINTAIERWSKCGEFAEVAFGMAGGNTAKFMRQWKDMGLPVSEARRLMRIARTFQRNTLGDKDQLRLIGLLPEAEQGNEGQGRSKDSFAWLNWAGKINAAVTDDSIDRMADVERKIALAKLEPLKRLIERLEMNL